MDLETISDYIKTLGENDFDAVVHIVAERIYGLRAILVLGLNVWSVLLVEPEWVYT